MPIPVPISAHNAPLVGDTLTTVQFNYEWRRLLVELIWQLTFDSFWSGSDVDITDAISKARALIEDLYTPEVVGMADYHGALVARSTNQTITGAAQVIFDTTANDGNHDTDGFWQVSDPPSLRVPVGLGGYYRAYAYLQFSSDVDLPAMELRRFGSSFLIFDRHFSQETIAHAIRLDAPIVLEDLDWVDLVVNVGAGSRDLIVGGHPYSARLGLYRIGDAP